MLHWLILDDESGDEDYGREVCKRRVKPVLDSFSDSYSLLDSIFSRG